MPSAVEVELLRGVWESLKSARHGQKSATIDRAAALMGCDPKTVRRRLAAAGFETNNGRRRKRRRDAGKGELSIEHLRHYSGASMASENNKGQRMPWATLIDIVECSARQRGEEWPHVSPSTLSRQLYAHHLHPEQLRMQTQSVQLTSKHPNHVWQVDSTTGAYYYLPGGRLRWMDEAEFNKNKVANLVKASSDLLTRYSIADHTTHAFKCRYYLGGESASNLLDFLVWAMWRQDSGPVWGVPLILMTDQGPANKSHLMANFCKRLRIEHIMHAPGNARATGSVEKSHDLARMHLETRFHFQDPMSVTLDKLNADAEAWAAAYCSTRVHTRHGRTRYAAWMEICRYPGALRAPASFEALREAAVGLPHTTRVRTDGRISFRGQKYKVDLVPGVIPGLRVTVQMNVFRAPAIDVQVLDPESGEESWQVVDPDAPNEWGYDGERVIGEGYRGVRNTVLDDNRALLSKQAYRTGDGLPTVEEAARARKNHAQAYTDTIDAMADVTATQVPAYLPRHVTPLPLPSRQVAARRLSIVDACTRLKLMMGDRYGPHVYSYMSGRFSDPTDRGVPEDLLAGIASELMGKDSDGALRAVQGA